MKFISQLRRTHYCGSLGIEHADTDVVVMGWVDTRRNHGGLVFIDLRDREGVVQVVLNPQEQAMVSCKDLRGEFVVAVSGTVRKRPEGMTNEKLKTGAIEIIATRLEILSESETPPFQISEENVNENLRLKYRYLDLRSPRLQQQLHRRHEITQLVRRFLSDHGFWEIETPILYKSTPEGARDYLVPSRINHGHFYALPQSPQTLKQLLMIAGYDRYFQIARCFRDEDLRADRQPEFTQIDIEMSFIDQAEIMEINEALLREMWKTFRGIDIGELPRLTYREAMARFGSDKPDTRFGMELKDLGLPAKGTEFKVFNEVLARPRGQVKGIAVPGGSKFSRSQIDKLTEVAKQTGAQGLLWIKSDSTGQLSSPVSKFLTPEKLGALFGECGGKAGDLCLIVADNDTNVATTLSTLRLQLGRELQLIDTSRDAFLWVTDFPLLEYSPEQKRWVACHHPFTSPRDEDMETLMSGDESKFGEILAKAYDLVCNGSELAGGSIRIYRTELQNKMFEALGLPPEERRAMFGFFLDALKYGTPPHGGIAWGMDRLAMILCGTEAIREVIAFPKTAKATDLMADAPSPVSRDQLLELGLRIINPSSNL